jgi:hypothetical protein
VRVRHAQTSDQRIVRWLDDVAFPLSSTDEQRAAPGELEAGIDAGEVTLLEVADEPIGYMHVDSSIDGCLYIRGMGVRPNAQWQTYGSQFSDHMLASAGADVRRRRAIITVTSPRNAAMLRILFGRGFAVRWALPDFFGPGRHRLGFQLRTTLDEPTGSRTRLVPVLSFSTIRWLVTERRHVARALIDTPTGLAFELGPMADDEFLPCPSPGSYYGGAPS